jgi:hypothetical protein
MGTQAGCKGTQHLKSTQKRLILVFYLNKTGYQWGYEGTLRVAILFRGYAEEKHYDLGVHEYRKVENHWLITKPKVFMLYFFLFF